MSIYDLNWSAKGVKLEDIREEPYDTIICINISEEARALVENSKKLETIQANAYNISDTIGNQIEEEATQLLEEEEK